MNQYNFDQPLPSNQSPILGDQDTAYPRSGSNHNLVPLIDDYGRPLGNLDLDRVRQSTRIFVRTNKGGIDLFELLQVQQRKQQGECGSDSAMRKQLPDNEGLREPHVGVKPIRRRKRGPSPEVAKRNAIIVAIHQEHPEWHQYKIEVEASRRLGRELGPHDVRNALDQHRRHTRQASTNPTAC